MIRLRCCFRNVLVLLFTAFVYGSDILLNKEISEDGQFSFVASLQKKAFLRQQYLHFCTGSIIGEKWILTAGHCFSQRLTQPSNIFKAAVGNSFLPNATFYQVSKVFLHPNQSESIQIIKNDLCLVQLQDRIVFSSSTAPVTLGAMTKAPPVEVVAPGWGRLSSSNSKLPNDLRFIRLNTVDYDRCQQIHSRRNNIVDNNTHVCTYGRPGDSLCFGDSGAPLVDVQTGLQVAVFSGLEDCSGDYPLLFMRVEVYLEWINEVTGLELVLGEG